MPKVSEGVKYNKKYTEQDVQNALKAMEGGMSQRSASAVFKVPRSTLQFRQSSNFHEKITHGPNPILSTDEEKLLEDWIISSQKKGFPIRFEDVQESVRKFLDDNPRQNPFKQNKPGEGWFAAFLRRHPNITLRTSEGITASSAVVSEADVRKWFMEIEQYLNEKHLGHILNEPSRIFNGDETCFYLCPKNKKVLAPKGTKNVYEVEHHPKTNLTVMFTFCANGDITPPMVIYPYQRIPSDVVKSVPSTWGVASSDNGWMKNHIFHEYVANILYKHLKKIGTVFPILLFVDGHVTHLTYELCKLCSELQIILISLYPNATRILQPADVACFKPLKNGWKTEVLQFRRDNPYDVVTKEKFAPILEKVVKNHLKPDTIKNGFKACGLYPWSPNAIDYSKCLGKVKNATNDVPSAEIEDDSFITFLQFREIIGEEKLQMLENTDDAKNAEDFSLKKMIECFRVSRPIQKPPTEKANKHNSPKKDLTTNGDPINTKFQKLTKNSEEMSIAAGYLDTSVSLNVENIPVILETDLPFVHAATLTSSNIEIIEIPDPNTVDNEVTGIDTREPINECVSDILETIRPSDLPFVHAATSTSSNIEITETSAVHIVNNEVTEIGTSEPVNECSINIETLSTSTASPPFKKYFLWPKTPERKGKKNSERISFVLTSSARQRDHIKKLEMKKKEDDLKEARKAKRLEAKKKREEEVERRRKQKDKGVVRKKCRKSKPSLEKNTNEVVLRNNDMLEEINSIDNNKENEKTKLRDILYPETDNIVLELEEESRPRYLIPERTKKNLFLNEKDNQSDILASYNEEKNPFTNPTISEGLCFKCVFNITEAKAGVKCAFCQRTYHLKCILNLKNNIEKTLFICPTCSKK